VTNSRLDGDVDVSRYVAQTASRLNERLADVSSDIRRALEEDIPELRGNAGVVELLGASVEGNVHTILRALRDDIAVQRVEAPAAALEYARRLAQHGVPVNALVASAVTQRVRYQLPDRNLGLDPIHRSAAATAVVPHKASAPAHAATSTRGVGLLACEHGTWVPTVESRTRR